MRLFTGSSAASPRRSAAEGAGVGRAHRAGACPIANEVNRPQLLRFTKKQR